MGRRGEIGRLRRRRRTISNWAVAVVSKDLSSLPGAEGGRGDYVMSPQRIPMTPPMRRDQDSGGTGTVPYLEIRNASLKVGSIFCSIMVPCQGAIRNHVENEEGANNLHDKSFTKINC